MSTGTTALMPLDPVVSPEQATRILPIRADLLPAEITAGRNARRVRVFLAVAIVLVSVVMGGWYVYAIKERNSAAADAAAADRLVTATRHNLTSPKYADVTKSIKTADKLRADLKAVLPQDLPWTTLLNQVRGTATAKKVTMATVVATLNPANSTTAAPGTVGTLQITGSAADKKTIAAFVDAVPAISAGGVHPLIHAYLTAAAQQGGGWTFAMNVDIATAAQCGRFTTPCKSGGY